MNSNKCACFATSSLRLLFQVFDNIMERIHTETDLVVKEYYPFSQTTNRLCIAVQSHKTLLTIIVNNTFNLSELRSWKVKVHHISSVEFSGEYLYICVVFSHIFVSANSRLWFLLVILSRST